MSYKPKYCCQCGDKIERKKWTFLASGRFCQLCETDFVFQEWTPRIIFALVLLFGLSGFYGYFQTAEKPLKIASLRPAEQTTESKTNPVGLVSNGKSTSNSAAQIESQKAANTVVVMPHQNAIAAKHETPDRKAENQTGSHSEVLTYFCGAGTKKGSPCSRRVKGGGRCWQHTGQPAILPPEKLIASR